MTRRIEDDDWNDRDEDGFDEDEAYEDEPDEGELEPTISCPYCHEEIFEDSLRCPYCEQYISQDDAPPRRKPWWIIIGFLLCFYVVYRWISP